MRKVNRQLLQILGLGWLGFLAAGLLITIFSVVPTVVVLVDRSYCSSAQWQQLVQNYQQLYRQYQQQTLHIKEVVLFSDLGQEVLTPPPTPEIIRDVPRYGRSNPKRQNQMQTIYPQAQLLVCQ